MLAGLPKAPARQQPGQQPAPRARAPALRDRPHAGDRLHHRRAGGRSRQEAKSCTCATPPTPTRLHAEYVAETVRAADRTRSTATAPTRAACKVYTSLVAAEQAAAYRALRKGIMDYERRQIYRGPEAVRRPARRIPKEARRRGRRRAGRPPRQRRRDGGRGAEGQRQGSHRGARERRARADHRRRPASPRSPGLSDKAPPNIKIRRGAVIRVAKTPKDTWEITQLPEVEGAFVAHGPARRRHQGAGRRLRLRQEQVQPRHAGLAPAGLELQALHLLGRAGKGLHARHGGQRRAAVLRRRRHRRPALGAEELRRHVTKARCRCARALAKSKNMVVHPRAAVDRHALRAGLDHAASASTRDKHPAYLPMALGAGSVTPMQMATALFGVRQWRLPRQPRTS